MTNEEAIEQLKGLAFIKLLENDAHSNTFQENKSATKKDSKDMIAIQMAISALEENAHRACTWQRGIPRAHCFQEIWFCPRCGLNVFIDPNSSALPRECNRCGLLLQATEE